MKEQIQQLIADGRTEEALALLAQHSSDALLLQARYNNGKKQYNMGLIEFSEWQRTQAQINYAALELSNSIKGNPKPVEIKNQESENIKQQPLEPKSPKQGSVDVFISYNSKDRSIANHIRDYLRLHNFTVTIDHEAVKAAEDIKSFIQNQMKKKGFILSLVSSNSLRSGWVGMESNLAFYSDLFETRQFIPVTIDAAFRENGFVIKEVKNLDAQLEEIYKEIEERRTLRIPIEDLKDEEGRLTELRNNLPKIVQRLKAINTIDINGDNFDRGMHAVVDAMRSWE